MTTASALPAPTVWRQYYALTKPRVVWLIVFTAIIGMFLATPGMVAPGVLIFGGLGMAKELPLERWFRELRIKRVGEGPSEVHRMVIARDLLK